MEAVSAQSRASEGRVDTLLVQAHGIAAFATLLVAVVFGILVSLQFIFPDLFAGLLPSWGRMRYAHTQGIMLGWLGNAFLAFLYHAVPVLTGRSVTGRNLGLALFGIWNFVVMLPGWALVLAGVSQPLEWAEFPLFVDVFVVLAFLLAALQFLPPFFRKGLADLYVSSWYIIGALVFTLLSYPMGNIVPEFVPGAAGAAFSGLWIHDAVGLFVTPLALAILYFVIPATTGRPVYSHLLSMLGFWGLFFLYPLNGTHHYIFSVIPMEAQMTAIYASFLLGVIVLIVVSNLMLSQRGSGWIPRDVGLRFVSMSVIFYLVVSIQGSLQANMALNQLTHFTDWVIGHSHLAMLGFATFAGIGGIIHAWQRIPTARYNPAALEWAYWLLTIGIWLMVIDLTLAGLVQGQAWQSGAPWLESLRESRPYWVIRSLTAIPITAGFIALFAGLTTGQRGAGADAVEQTRQRQAMVQVAPTLAEPVSGAPARVLGMSYVVASVAGVVFFAFSVSLLGELPRRMLADQTMAMAPASPLTLTPSEQRGRDIYAREGCGYCHTQQVRYIEADIARYGAPSLAWEGRFDFPHLLGTRRIGPDLARATDTRNAEWHFVHLYAPRSVVPGSIMPGYPQFFDGAPDQPRQEARDIVAYLETLGRARELAYPEGDAIARAAAGDSEWAQMAFSSPVLNAHPGKTQPRGSAPALPGADAEINGQALWLYNCSGCHGVNGDGTGPASAWLQPPPSNLTARTFSAARLADTLWNGVHGTAMPGWRDQTPESLAALVEVVRGFGPDSDAVQASPDELAQGAQVYARHCAECHGDTGTGDGFAADQLPIMPTDFTGERPVFEESQRVLRNGVPGTSMAPWTDRLNDAEIAAVSHFVRQFYQDTGTAGGTR